MFSQSALTCRTNSVGVFVFGAENGLLHHPQEDHARYPELDPQQILPVAGGPEEPEQRVQDVHDAHHHVELHTHTTRETGHRRRPQQEEADSS